MRMGANTSGPGDPSCLEREWWQSALAIPEGPSKLLCGAQVLTSGPTKLAQRATGGEGVHMKTLQVSKDPQQLSLGQTWVTILEAPCQLPLATRWTERPGSSHVHLETTWPPRQSQDWDTPYIACDHLIWTVVETRRSKCCWHVICC